MISSGMVIIRSKHGICLIGIEQVPGKIGKLFVHVITTRKRFALLVGHVQEMFLHVRILLHLLSSIVQLSLILLLLFSRFDFVPYGLFRHHVLLRVWMENFWRQAFF